MSSKNETNTKNTNAPEEDPSYVVFQTLVGSTDPEPLTGNEAFISLIGQTVSMEEYVINSPSTEEVNGMWLINDISFSRWRKIGVWLANKLKGQTDIDNTILTYIDEREFAVVDDVSVEEWRAVGRSMIEGSFSHYPYSGKYVHLLYGALNEVGISIISPGFSRDSLIYSTVIGKTNDVKAGLHVIIGKSGQGKSTLLNALGSHFGVDVIKSGEPIPNSFESIDDAFRVSLLSNKVAVIDSIKNGLYEEGGSTASGGVNMTFFSRMAVVASRLTQNGFSVFTAINPATDKEDIYLNIVEAVKSNATTLIDLSAREVFHRDFSTGVEIRRNNEGLLSASIQEDVSVSTVLAAIDSFSPNVSAKLKKKSNPIPAAKLGEEKFASYHESVQQYLTKGL